MDISKLGHHTTRQFDHELENIRNRVLTMGGLVEQQLALAVSAFVNNDTDIAEKVIHQGQPVNQLEVSIDEECVQVLARRQPAAFDLRLLVVVIKTVNQLERVGDQAERIAQMVIHLDDIEKSSCNYSELQHLANLVKDMLHGALDAFARMDVAAIMAITEKDTWVDREYVSIIRQLITRMMDEPRNIRRALDVLWAARALERIGDYSVNICENVIYLVLGKDVRHLSREEIAQRLRG